MTEHLFLTVLEAGKFKIKFSADLVSDEGPLSGSQIANLLLCPHMVDKSKRALQDSLIKGLISLMRAPSSWHDHLPKAPSPYTIILEVRIST